VSIIVPLVRMLSRVAFLPIECLISPEIMDLSYSQARMDVMQVSQNLKLKLFPNILGSALDPFCMKIDRWQSIDTLHITSAYMVLIELPVEYSCFYRPMAIKSRGFSSGIRSEAELYAALRSRYTLAAVKVYVQGRSCR